METVTTVVVMVEVVVFTVVWRRWLWRYINRSGGSDCNDGGSDCSGCSGSGSGGSSDCNNTITVP